MLINFVIFGLRLDYYPFNPKNIKKILFNSLNKKKFNFHTIS